VRRSLPYARTLGRLVPVAAAGALLLPGSALADTTVDFEQFAPGTVITNQYADLGGAGQGVVFGPLPSGAGTGLNPVIRMPPAGQAQSGSQVADIATCGCENFELMPRTTGTFVVPRSRVSVDVGYLGPPATCVLANPGTACAYVTLLAFDAGGNQIAASSPTLVRQNQGVHTLLSVSTPSASIFGFEITARGGHVDDNKQIAIDDLSFDTPSAPPSPDFSLTPDSTNVKVVQGGSVSDKIAIGRFGGSAGNVTFTETGALGLGVHLAFVPNPAAGGVSTLTLIADANAPPTTGGDRTVTITGTPGSSSAGPSPRSFTLTFGVKSAFDVRVAGSTSISLASCVVSVPVEVTRDFAFSGPVALSVSGLPPGVTASFAPAQVTFPNGAAGQTVALNLTAPATGEALLRRTATIHASAPLLVERTATFMVGGTCPLQYDARVTSLQITQGVQSPFLPSRDPAHPPSVTAYSEIPDAAMLRGGGPTVVRVYADLAFGPAAGVPNIPAVLAGWTHNRVGGIVPLPGSPLLPTSGPRTLQPGGPLATVAEEGKETGAYTFTLPPSWTHGEIGISAQLLPSQGAPTPIATATANAAAFGQPSVAPCQSVPCMQNDTMSLTRIPFYEARAVSIVPVQMTVGDTALPDPASVFKWARLVTPLNVIVKPYAGTVDITDLSDTFTHCNANALLIPDQTARFNEQIRCSDQANAAGSDRFDTWVCDHSAPDSDPSSANPGWDIGVNTGVARGGTQHRNYCWSNGIGNTIESDAVVELHRPLTSVAHEFFHLLGRPHASGCNGGGSNGQTAESWPPDEMGFTQSIGLDTTLGSGTAGGPYALPSPPPTSSAPVCDSAAPVHSQCPPSANWFDFMSYCAFSGVGDPLTSGDAWGSVHNWNAVLEASRYHAKDLPGRRSMARARNASAHVPSLRVSAILNHDGTASVASVTPVEAPPEPPSQSGFHLIGSDISGKHVADVQMLVNAVHVDGEVPPVVLDGVIPAAGVASVAIVRNGSKLAGRQRSAHAPTVALHGIPIAKGTKTTIGWSAHDADGNALTLAIDYSADDGRHYEQIWSGPDKRVARVPTRYLSRSSTARIRVTVSDGFWTATATSRRFRSPGAPPVVSILSPASGVREPNDAPLVLAGQAFDDRLRLLTGRQLRWLLGRRLLGAGAQISVAGLPAGRHRIDLVARDRDGRTSRASVQVNLGAARPLFLILRAPAVVPRTAHSVPLTVASSLDATLVVRVSGLRSERFAVDRRTRRMTVRIRRGRKALRLQLLLSSGGQTRTAVLTLRRR
jgi:hypothetical protein